MTRILTIFAIIVAVAAFALSSDAASGDPTVTQRVYHYQAGSTIQTDVPCGGATTAELIYWEISVSALGPYSYSVADRVDTPNVPGIWGRNKGDAAVHTGTGVPRMAEDYFQRLTTPGRWVFHAQIAGRPSTASTCEITKL
jgi:hypothetical protein